MTFSNTDMSICFASRNFITKIAQLAHFAGVSREATAMFIHAGRSRELAATIRQRLSPLLQDRLEEEMDDLVAKAGHFMPPDSLPLIRTMVYRAAARFRAEPYADAPVFIPGEEDAMDALSRLVRLTTALSYPPRIIARMVYAGRFATLVDALYTDNRLRASAFHVRELNDLAAIADDFVLPERFALDPELLVERVERIAGR